MRSACLLMKLSYSLLFFIPATDVYFSCGFIYNIFVCQLVLFVMKSHKLAAVIYIALVRITIHPKKW